MGYIHFIHEMQTLQGKQRSVLHGLFYYLWPTKKRCGLTFLHWKGKKKKCTGKHFLKLAMLLFLLFLSFSLAYMEILASIR